MRSEQRVLSVSETVRRPIPDYGVLARLSDHRGRVRIVPQKIVRDRVLLASGSVTVRASVRATVVHADVDTFDTAAGFSLVPVFGGGDAVAGDPLDQALVDACAAWNARMAQIDLDCACFQPDRAVRDRAPERGGHRFDLAAFRRTDVLPVQGRTDMAVAVGQARAVRILIPINRCDNIVAGVADVGMSSLIDDAVQKIAALAAK